MQNAVVCGEALHKAIAIAARQRCLLDAVARHGQCRREDTTSYDDLCGRCVECGGRDLTAAQEGEPLLGQGRGELRQERVRCGAGTCGKAGARSAGERAIGEGSSGYVDVAGRVQRERQSLIAALAQMCLAQQLRRSWIQLEQAHAILRVQQCV